MNRRVALEPYDMSRGPQALGAVWTDRTGARELYCTLFSHPHGWELKLRADRLIVRRQICRTADEVFDVADTWRREAVPEVSRRVAGALTANGPRTLAAVSTR